MPPRPTADGQETSQPHPATDPFGALDQEFETVQRALVRGGLDPAEALEVGGQTMMALWRWSVDDVRVRGPGLADLATRVAGAFAPEGTTRERSSGERSPRPDGARAE
jgi:hypothetical protein